MNRKFPDLLKLFHAIKIDYDDGNGIDFEPFDCFFTETETADWIKAWTGNDTLNGHEYLIFGQDGSGGYVAFWHVRDTEDLLQQPIVFFGSEGTAGVIAQNFDSYIRLFANGVGPYEAIENPGFMASNAEEFIAFAEAHSASSKSSVAEIVERAKAEFPYFEKNIDDLCK